MFIFDMAVVKNAETRSVQFSERPDMSSHDQHMIHYASPSHEAVGVVECTCGWVVTRALREDEAHDSLIKDLLDEWLDHQR